MNFNALLVESGKIIIGFVLEILYFPAWWYTAGFLKALRWSKNFIAGKARGLALSVWIKNIFTPMFGQRDWAGMLISFFMRLFQIIVRTVALLFWAACALAVILLWLAAPLYIAYQIIFQFEGLI